MALCFLSTYNFEANPIHHLSSDLDNNLEIETSDRKIVTPHFPLVSLMMYGFIGKAARCLSFHAVAARISRVVVQPNPIESLLGPEWLLVV